MGWTLIQHTALTSSAASVTLGSGGTIPQTYKTLKLVVSIRTSGSEATGNANAAITFNGSSANLTRRSLYGNGAPATVGSTATTSPIAISTSASNTANTFSNVEITIPNYAGSTNKPFSIDGVNEDNATNATQLLDANLRSLTEAITSITLTGTSNLVSGSTFTLYGLS